MTHTGKSLASSLISELRHAADQAISEGDYEAHPEYHVIFQRLATPKLVRAICEALLNRRDGKDEESPWR